MISNNASQNDFEIIGKAIKRAKQALNQQGADLAVGFAEGAVKRNSHVLTVAWCALVTEDSKQYLSGGLQIELPRHLLEKYKTDTLLETDVENYLQELFTNPFERLVEYVMISYQNDMSGL